MTLNPALAALPDSPFPRLDALLAGVTPPAGLAPIVMAIGEPRHAPPPLLAEAVAANGHLWGRYPPLRGTQALRRACADWLGRRYGLPSGMIDAERNVVAVAGTREALFLMALVAVPRRKAGRRAAVLFPNPFYQTYAGAAVAAGAEPVYLAARREDGFLPRLDGLSKDLLARTALVYLCSPSNPEGAIADDDYLRTAIGLAREHDFVLAVDECYAEIYDRDPPPGALEVCKDMDGGGNEGVARNVVVLHSLSKRSSAPGLRSGFVAGDAMVVAAFAKLRGYSSPTLPLPLQAAAAALWDDDAHVAASRDLYRRKFDMCERALAGRRGFFRPAGGFYLWLEVGADEDVTVRLWRQGAIKSLPGTYLSRPGADGHDPGRGFVRFSLVHDEDTTAEALDRLGRLL